MEKMDVVNEIRELKTQLAYSKNIGFFFGAGTSCALKIPNIETLTSSIESKLSGDAATHFQILKNDLEMSIPKANIEHILNQTRRIREIANDESKKEFMGISGEAAKALDKNICNFIYEIISTAEEKADLTTPTRFFAWLNNLNRDFLKEVFTTNYDLIVERSLEANQIPYFDGFVGSYEPFFWQESIDQQTGVADITRNWIRLWKIHGSLSWFWNENKAKLTQRIIRVGKFDNASSTDKELVIYPSKEKYDSSRKQPFVAYFDRLRAYLLSGELLFIFSGYSFSDQHINEIVFNCLRQNNRLYCVVFFYLDDEVESLHKHAGTHMNMNVFGPTKAIVNGALVAWTFNKLSLKDGEKCDNYYDETKGVLRLGDFNDLVAFFASLAGKPVSLL